MAFVVTTRNTPIQDSAVRRARRRITGRLRRRLGASLRLSPQQRAERYVAHLPTAVLGAC